jgi:hypothetical protein
MAHLGMGEQVGKPLILGHAAETNPPVVLVDVLLVLNW